MIAVRVTHSETSNTERPTTHKLNLPLPTIHLESQGGIASGNEAFAHWVDRPLSELAGLQLSVALRCLPSVPFGTDEVVRCGCSKPSPCWTAGVTQCLSSNDLSITFFPTQGFSELEDLRGALSRAVPQIAMGKIAAGIAHEINNPISYVLSNVQFVAEQTASTGSPEVAAALKEALIGVERLIALGRDLQLFIRPMDEQVGLLEIKPVIDMALTLTRPEFNRRARLTTELGMSPLVTANKAQLVQALSQLLLHAAHAIPARQADQRRLFLSLRGEGNTAVIELRDPARILSSEEHAGLFSASAGNLGLMLARSQLNAFGAQLAVHSDAESGTRFTMTLAGEPVLAAPPGKLRILVIDDDLSVGKFLLRLLRAKHDATLMQSAVEALSWLSANPVDVVLCDLAMPEMSGLEFLQALQANGSFPPERVILLSGAIGAVDHSGGAVANLQLAKPCSALQLDAALAKATAVRSQ